MTDFRLFMYMLFIAALLGVALVAFGSARAVEIGAGIIFTAAGIGVVSAWARWISHIE